MRAIAEEASALVRQYKGAYSGEHGDGLCRGEWIAWQFGPKIDAALRRDQAPARSDRPARPRAASSTRRRWTTPAVPLPARLPDHRPASRSSTGRPGTSRTTPLTEATSAPGSGGDPSGGLAKAVEMCNNNGHCRKFDAGTMCPSYRVTRDEQHLTRGRANTLRLALSGQLTAADGDDPLASDAVHEALDLCVGCKGCRRECPTGVDMAKMKLEATARRKARHGHTLKDRLLGGLPDHARHWSRMPWLPNLRNRVPAWPGWASAGSASRRGARCRRGAATPSAQVAPALGLASREEALAAPRGGGALRRHLQRQLRDRERRRRGPRAAGGGLRRARGPRRRRARCAAAARYLAAGMPERARAKARELLEALLPFAERGIAIVGLEPSCLLTLRDEMLVMGLGAPGARSRRPRAAVRGIRRARSPRPAASPHVSGRRRRRCWSTATATRRRSAPCRRCWRRCA